MNSIVFSLLLGNADARCKCGLYGRARKYFVRKELKVQRLFDWFDIDGEWKLTGDFQDGKFIETFDYRLEQAVIGRAYAEGMH